MAPTPSIVIVQAFTYRLQYEEWSNRYHFNGTVPSTNAEWKTMADALITKLQPCFSAATSFVRAYGYVASQVSSVWTNDYSPIPANVKKGTSNFVGNPLPGDVAATTRWETGALNSRGKKIYLRKYWHDVRGDVSIPDKLTPTQLTAFQTLAQQLVAGTALGGTQVLAGPNGVTAGTPETNVYLTTRTLKRRGRRPLP